MGEAKKYFVTVAVDQCIVPERVMIRAGNQEFAAQKAEMKLALKMRGAITVQAIKVQDV
jgi:hypothetical protein